MAMTMTSKECRQYAEDLQTSANNMFTILDSNLKQSIADTKKVYSSDTAEQIYAAYNKMAAQVDEFVNAIKNCSAELTRAAGEIEGIEVTGAGKVG
ncbi:MAG: hypothetical protein IJY25_01015 [Bacilli bacterium]|nr:hypothetical protein [Bacilli bacterium]